MKKLIASMLMLGVASGAMANYVIGSDAATGAVWVRDPGVGYESSATGYGDVTASCRITGGGYAVANSAGQVYVRSSDLGSWDYLGSGFGAVTAMAGLENGRWAIGNGAGELWVSEDSVGTTINKSTSNFGAITAMDGVAGGGWMVGSSTAIWVRKADDSGWDFAAAGYGNVTAVAGLVDGGWVVGNDAGSVWVAADNQRTSWEETMGVGYYNPVVDLAPLADGGWVLGTDNALYARADGGGSHDYAAAFADVTAVTGLDGGGWVVGTTTAAYSTLTDNRSSGWADIGVGGAPITALSGIVPIPEPATLGLVAVMGGGLLWMRRRLLI